MGRGKTANALKFTGLPVRRQTITLTKDG